MALKGEAYIFEQAFLILLTQSNLIKAVLPQATQLGTFLIDFHIISEMYFLERPTLGHLMINYHGKLEKK